MAARRLRMRSRLDVLILFALAILAMLWTPRLEGHLGHGPSLGERYLKLDVREARVRVVYGVTYASKHGRRVRQEADLDRDGVIDEAELAKRARWYRDRVREGVSLQVDGDARSLEWSAPFVGGLAGPIVAGPATVELTAEVALSPGRHEVTLIDGAEFTGIYRTAIVLETEPTVELSRSGQGREPRGRDRRTVIMDLPSPGEPAARIFSSTITLPGEPDVDRTKLWGTVLGLGILAGLAGVGALVSRSISGRRRDSREP